MTDAENTFLAIDSLCANEFAMEIDGESIDGIFRVSGLTTFKLDTVTLKPVQEPFQLVKMVQRDGNNAFNRWLRETTAAKDGSRPTRTVAVVAIDDRVETRRWTATNAWISAVNYSDFNSASFEMVEEAVTIQYESLEETWPATAGL
jgi:hypothetical protein